jgi:hypothetical protein
MEGENLQELVKKQAETIKRLEARIVELEAVIACLQKNSRNSSKPPSSDIVKPKTAGAKESNGNRRRIGGQPGHKKHERIPFSGEHVDQFIEATLSKCPLCGGLLEYAVFIICGYGDEEQHHRAEETNGMVERVSGTASVSIETRLKTGIIYMRWPCVHFQPAGKRTAYRMTVFAVSAVKRHGDGMGGRGGDDLVGILTLRLSCNLDMEFYFYIRFLKLLIQAEGTQKQ